MDAALLRREGERRGEGSRRGHDDRVRLELRRPAHPPPSRRVESPQAGAGRRAASRRRGAVARDGCGRTRGPPRGRADRPASRQGPQIVEGRHDRPVLEGGDAHLPRAVRPRVRAFGRGAPEELLPRFLRLPRNDVVAGTSRRVQAAARVRAGRPLRRTRRHRRRRGHRSRQARLPRDDFRHDRGELRGLDGVGARTRREDTQSGARRAGEPPGLLRRRRHPRNRDVQHGTKHPHVEVRVVPRARKGRRTRLGGKLHVDRRAFLRDARRMQALHRPAVPLRRRPRVLPRVLLLAAGCRMAGLVLLRDAGDESAQPDLARRADAFGLDRPLSVHRPDVHAR